jgi:hypothetical protein
VGTLFAAFLGYNPVRELLGPHVLSGLPAGNAQTLTGREFFPHLISGPFHDGLMVVFSLAIVMSLVAAAASLLRGRTGRAGEAGTGAEGDRGDVAAGAGTGAGQGAA